LVVRRAPVPDDAAVGREGLLQEVSSWRGR
jgi:hypothetical protein